MLHDVSGQVPEANYDESKVVVENLPPLMLSKDKQVVTDAAQWDEHRAYLVDQLADFVYGHAPAEQVEVDCSIVSEGTLAESSVRFRQLDVKLSRGNKSCTLQVAMFLPDAGMPIRGTFLLPNFTGNHGITPDSQIRVSPIWQSIQDAKPNKNVTASDQTRGDQARRCPIEMITQRGYVLATVFYGDIDPDFDDGFENGVHALFPDYRLDADHPSRWGSIAAWAWGLSRCTDALLTQPEIAESHLAVIGHSRLGKTALWAGATDPRFSIEISNDSGCGGAALSRRNFGESIWRINTVFPHWFCDRFKQFNEDPSQLPVDQHFLIASIAPRKVYIASATEDLWADPMGEYTSGFLANSAYELLGQKGLPTQSPPSPGISVGDNIGYHLRVGKHDLLVEDWEHYLNFADRHW